MPGMEVEPEVLVRRLQSLVECALPALVPETKPAGLYEPVRYVLSGGGKRLRPVLLLLVGEAYGAEAGRLLPAALAVEVFHNFTLVHDDIMDHAATRRGRPTVHVRWDESTAILCGDYLLAMAYDLLTAVETGRLRDLLQAFHQMVARLCEGQALDKHFEGCAQVSVADYLHMIDGKTGALLELAFELGGLLGDAPESHRTGLRMIGRHVGRAFQIQDDLLDLTAPDRRWGKVIGGDLIEGKKTYLLLWALERASGAERVWFERILERGGLEPDLVPEARARMESLGVLEEASSAVASHSSAALGRLGLLPEGPARRTIGWLLKQMQARRH